jgi:crotonyl-CoA carboxylase/reductase
MVVICAGTSGYSAMTDLRQLWCRQKRFQGSHFADQEHSVAFNHLVCQGKIDPCLTKTFEFRDIPLAHQYLHDNRGVFGKFAALVGAPAAGAKTLADFTSLALAELS